MVKNVLLVDDDQEMLLSLQEGLAKYRDTFSVSLAGDGKVAAEKLAVSAVSLVVTDLKMPEMDGFALLSHIMEHYPHVPVIIMTAFSTPKMEQMAKQGGAVGYIEKPFLIDDLARRIVTALRRESEGGTLHSVSSGMFLQLIEMEGKTCTIRLVDQATGRRGILFFRGGELIDARTEDHREEAAAYEIFSWEKVNLSIQNRCPQKQRTIHTELQAIYMDAMRLKDESDSGDPVPAGRAGRPEEAAPAGSGPAGNDPERVRSFLASEFGRQGGIGDVSRAPRWDGFVERFRSLGAFFRYGDLQVGYVDRPRDDGVILLPDASGTVAISVSPKSPRDKILQTLTSRDGDVAL